MIRDLNNGSARASDAELDAALAGQEGEFSKGIRSGALGMGAGVNNFLGGVGGAVGANDFATGRYAAADQYAQEAAAAAPRVNSIRDIHGLGDFGDYAAGQLGQLVPAAGLGVGATLLSGGAALPGMIAGTAAMAPLEIGDTIGRQRERGLPVNLGDAALSGVGSAALQSIVPGMVGAKLAGKAASTAPMTLRRAAGQVGADAGIQGAAGAGGEAAKQVGSGTDVRNLDTHALMDAGVGNVLAGGALGGLGVAGEYAHGKAGAVSEGLGTAKNGATGLLASAKDKLKGAGKAVADAAEPLTDAASSAASQAKEKLDGYEIPDRLSELWSSSRTKAKDMLRKVADSEDIVGDAKEFAGAQGEKLRAKLAGDDDSRLKTVKEWADGLVKENLTPEQQAVVQDWVANPGDHAKQAAVAGLKMAKDKVTDLGSKLKDFAQRVVERADEKGVKKSEDYSGVDAAIGREITPILQEAHPELFTHGGEDARLNAARVIRGLVGELASGKRPSADTVASLIDLLGPKATDMIEAGYRVVGSSADKKKTASFFQGMNEVMGTKDEHLGMVQALRKTLKPEFQRSVSDSELGVEARMLRKWAETGREAGDTDHVFTYKDRKVREGLAARYTDPDAVMAALEKTLPKKDNQIERARPEVDEDGNILGEKGGHGMDREIELAGQRLQVHAAKGGVMYERPEYTPKNKFHQSAVEQRLAKIEGKTKPRMLGVDELGADHPIVEATRADLVKRGEELLKRIRLSGIDEQLGHLTMRPTDTMDFPRGFERDVYEAVRNKGLKGVDIKAMAEDALQHHAVPTTEVADSPLVVTGDEMRAMALDTHAHGKSPSRIDTGEGGPILDAVRMQRFMSDRFGKEYTTGDEKSRVARLGRMFVEAAAAAQEHLGRSFDVPDSLVIGRIGSNDITLGMARKLDPRTKADIAYDETSNKLLELRKAFREASGQDPKDGKRVRPKPANPREMYNQALAQDKVLEKARDDVAKRDFAKDSEHIKDEDRQEGNDTSGFGGIVERGLNRRLTHSRPGKDEISGNQTADRLGDADRSMTQSPRMQRINELRGDMSMLSEKTANGTATNADRVKSKAVWNEIEQLLAHPDSPLGSGRKEIDPFGPTHDAMRGSEDGSPIFTDSGEARQDGVGAPSLTGPSRKPKNIDALIQGARDVVGMFKRPDLDSDTVSLRGGLSDYSLRQINPSKWEILDKDYNVVHTMTAKEPPSPKAVAAKKAALKDAASSGDPALVHELRTSSDAAGIQRAVAELLKGKTDENTRHAIDEANARLSELVRDNPDVSYGLQTKKYSMMGYQLHAENSYEGFPATHDSPIKHEGRFDWRSHEGKGEGNAAFGAGTYLSTAEGTHRNYKNQFTAKVEREAPQSMELLRLRDKVNGNSDRVLDLMQERDELGAWRARVGGRLDHFPTQEAARTALDDYRQGRLDRLDQLKQKLIDKISPEGLEYNISAIRKDIAYIEGKLLETDGNQPEHLQGLINETTEHGRELLKNYEAAKAKAPQTKSPTYEVSVNIPHDKLLDWNKPLNEQSGFIQEAVMGALSADKGMESRVFTNNVKLGAHENTTGERLYKMLQSRFDGSQRKASDFLQSLGILGNVHDAQFGKEKQFRNYVIYDDSKIQTNYVHFSKQDAQRAEPGTGPQDRKSVYEYIKRVLGDKINVAWRDILHAGEFERLHMPDGSVEDVIRLSIHSMNPLGAAHHEALHGFFERLRDMKQGNVMDVLDKASSSAPVLNQLKKLLANEPHALKQLSNAEERAAYMYQFWAAGKLTIGDQTRNVFQRIADFVRSVLGIWSNDERALHILDYFHKGEFAKDSTKQFARDVVSEKLMAPGRNKAVEAAKRMTQPFREIGESLAVAGGARLRDTGIPALRELADAMKLHGTAEGEDAGFLPAARAARAQVMNDLGAKLKGASQASLTAALESLQTKSNATIDALASPEARLAARMAKKEIRKTLDDMFKYMEDRGVDVKDLGVGKDYFPRQYDASFISSHQAEFKAVLAKHGISNPDNVMKKIVGAEGAEFTVETDKPGMQALKARTLAHIPDAELAPFMRKNVFEIMNSYITQATRRGEWADRFGDKNQRIDGLMQQAQREGATPEQMKAAQNFIRSVDGTLGDTINPEARRLIGNMIVYQNIRLLPLAIFSSVVDPLGVMVRGGTVHEGFNTFKRGITEIAKNFKKNPQDDAMTQLAASMGVIDDTTLVHTLGALYSQGMVGDTGRKINDTFFRYNLMEQFNTSMRVGATEAALNFLKRHSDGTASPHSERWLQELGLQKGGVKLDANGRPDVSDPAIKMAVNRWVDGAVLRPDAVDKPIWMSDPHFALIAHLKQFVFSFHETILKRVGHEFDHGNYAPAMALASYVPVMMAADFMKGFIQGGGAQPSWKENWDASDWLESGIERGGLYGTGQFAVDAFKDIHRGGSGIGALVGPTLEQLTDAVRVMGGREQFGHFALKSMPANALYAKALGGEATDPKFVD